MVFNTGAALLDAIVLAVVSKEEEGTYCRMFITVIPTCLAGRQQRICMMASCMRTLRELPAPPRWLRFISCFFSHPLVW